MKPTRRMQRMGRNRKKRLPGLNLTSLMDVFTILVFFLLVNSSSSEVLTPPKNITLPDSVVETKPKETVVILVSEETVMVAPSSVPIEIRSLSPEKLDKDKAEELKME